MGARGTERGSFRVDFEPVGRHGGSAGGEQSLLGLAQTLGVPLISICGGHGQCGRCRVQAVSGTLTELTEAERAELRDGEIAQGVRLACQAHPLSDCTVFVPADSLGTAMRSQVEGLQTSVAIDPPVRAVPLELAPASLERPRADASAILAGLAQATGSSAQMQDVAVLRELSPHLRAWDWRCVAHVRLASEVVAVASPGSVPVGLAVDLGTTGVAGYLVELERGQVLASRGTTNPQISFGEDVVSRVAAARRSPAAREGLRSAAVACINALAQELCADAAMEPADIVEAVVVGNTAMHHLLLGLPTEQLALAPFVPAVSGALDVKARDVGLALAPGAYVHLPPNIAAFVGSDHVAMLLATAEQWRGRVALALDIGTNTEISLLVPDVPVRSLSCPSGPAFEGYRIKDGMRATPGAIERVQVTPDDVLLQTIDELEPSGICGSGIVDVLAQLHLAGVLSANGRIQLGSHPRVRENGDGRREFVLAGAGAESGRGAISVTQEDVREILLAKAAIGSGIAVLLDAGGLAADDLEIVIIAGAFGSYLDIPNAVAAGMLPALPPERFHQVGNASGMGAKLALTSMASRARARTFRSDVQYIELAGYPGFVRRFADACRLGGPRPRAHAAGRSA